MDLARVPTEVAAMYFVITSFSGESFSQTDVVDASLALTCFGCDPPLVPPSAAPPPLTHTEAFADFAVGGRGEHRAMVLCRVVRGMEPLCWEVVSLGIPYADAATARLLVAPVRQHFGANPPCTC